MTLVCLPKSHFTSNPHGEDDEEDGEEDGADVEEEDAEEEAEERRRPRQGKAIKRQKDKKRRLKKGDALDGKSH